MGCPGLLTAVGSRGDPVLKTGFCKSRNSRKQETNGSPKYVGLSPKRTKWPEQTPGLHSNRRELTSSDCMVSADQHAALGRIRKADMLLPGSHFRRARHNLSRECLNLVEGRDVSYWTGRAHFRSLALDQFGPCSPLVTTLAAQAAARAFARFVFGALVPSVFLSGRPRCGLSQNL